MAVDEKPKLLAQRDFRLWFLSRSTSLAGTAASAVALPLLAYQTTGSAGLTAAVAGLGALPYLLFGLLTGAAADRLRRKAMMVSADVWCAVLLTTLPLAQALGEVASWHLLTVAFGIGCGFCWFDSAGWGALARLVGKARLAEANSLIIVYALCAAALVGLVANPILGAALLLWAVWEFGRTTGNVNGITIRQQLTPDELQGRVNTTGRMIAWGGAPFGALIGGVVAEAAGLRAACLVLAVPLLVGLAVLLTSPVRTYHADPSML